MAGPKGNGGSAKGNTISTEEAVDRYIKYLERNTEGHYEKQLTANGLTKNKAASDHYPQYKGKPLIVSRWMNAQIDALWDIHPKNPKNENHAQNRLSEWTRHDEGNPGINMSGAIRELSNDRKSLFDYLRAKKSDAQFAWHATEVVPYTQEYPTYAETYAIRKTGLQLEDA